MAEPEPPDPLAIAAAVADETPVEWPEAVSALGPAARSLEAIAAVAAAYRAARREAAPASQRAAEAVLFEWGHLRVLEKLGEGAFGEVYRARDPNLDRQVALKLRRAGPTSESESGLRFLAEARRLARVRHPNVLDVHGADVHDGRVGMWSDWIEGETLEARLAAHGPLGPREVAAIGLDLCRALAAVHAAGLVHGDLKATNVLRERGGRLVLVDFGASSELAGFDGGFTPGARGTPLTMAPELLRGAEPTARSDLYSLGVLLYRLLTGRYPVEGSTLEEVRRRHESGGISPLHDARADVPARLASVVERALAYDPQERFASAGALERALVEALAPTGTVLIAERRSGVRRRRSRWGWGAAIGVAALVAAVGAGLLWDRAGRSREAASPAFLASLAVLPFAPAEESPEADTFARGITEALIAELTRVPALRVTAFDSAARAASDGGSWGAIARRLDVEHLLTGSTAAPGGRIEVRVRLVRAATGEARWAERFEGSREEAFALQQRIASRVALAIHGELVPPAASSRSPQIDPLALERYLEARQAWSRRQRAPVERSILLFREAIDLQPDLAEAWAGLADAYAIAGSYGWMPMRESHPAARAAATEALALDPASAEAHASLALVLTDYYWEWTEALQHFERAIAARPGYATAHQWYAETLANLGRFEEALAEARLAWHLDPLSLAADLTVGETLYKARRHAEAVRHLEGTVRRHPEYGIAELVLALATIQDGRVEAGLSRLESARRRWPELLEVASLLGWAYGVAEQPDEARQAVAELEALRRRGHVPPILLAYPQIGLGEREAALESLEGALAARDWQLKLLAVDPVVEPLRAEPRFEALLARVGLPTIR